MNERVAITIRGTVQGVGFRPFVFGLAKKNGLMGRVWNEAGQVAIEVEGEPRSIACFLEELKGNPPPAARMESVTTRAIPVRGETEFLIAGSTASRDAPVAVSPDLATCDDCLRELRDPADRRHGYPFLNCTACGPRLSIVVSAPYDRARTSMAGFVMCPECQREYDDPSNRRFHAQPVACPRCGPRLALFDAQGQRVATAEPLQVFAQAIAAGKIGALKGIGGFHLICRATDSQAVDELRRRKRRDEKPFAVMVRDLEAAREICQVSEAEARVLSSTARPIVLLHRRDDDEVALDCRVAENVAPRNTQLGVLLPYAPLHPLLFDLLEGEILVLTSGNRSDEPIAYEDEDALERLAGIADVFLGHDRPILTRCDDSVVRLVDDRELPLRRSRGYAPQSLRLPHALSRPAVAVGGQLKSVFAFAREDRATLSHHLGDLDHYEAYRAFERDIALYEALFEIRPELIVHDLHPDYASTRYAIARAEREGQKLLAVQHHHAHLAGCLAEHGVGEPAIGVIFDGSGNGPDGTIWGGEFLVGNAAGYRRAGRLRPVPLAGGEQAIREPWRVALAWLREAELPRDEIAARRPAAKVIEQMLERRVSAPLTSSIGRLFDAVASLAEVRDVTTYEGQAAQELEWLATGVEDAEDYPFEIREAGAGPSLEPDLELDARPLIQAVVRDRSRQIPAERIARRFHNTLAQAIVEVVVRIRTATGLETVALSGGVFANGILSSQSAARLASRGFRVLRHQQTPPGDGGLAFGQLAVAAGMRDPLLP